MTNHFRFLPYQHIKYSLPFFQKWTNLRLERTEELLKIAKSRKDLEKILSDHKNGEFSICNHTEGFETSSAFIIQTEKPSLWYSRGKPCKNTFKIYRF
ncbi:MAG: hypothetical protein QXY45_03630 [Candidatus Aenigmatarchaeota archaeon]